MRKKIDLEQKEIEFAEMVMDSVDSAYDLEMIQDFCTYWTEPNKSLTKVRWESEKFFHVGRRLATWARNQNRWNKNSNQQNQNLSATQMLRQKHGI